MKHIKELLLKQDEYHGAKSLSESSDGDMKELAKEEVSIVEADIQDLEKTQVYAIACRSR